MHTALPSASSRSIRHSARCLPLPLSTPARRTNSATAPRDPSSQTSAGRRTLTARSNGLVNIAAVSPPLTDAPTQRTVIPSSFGPHTNLAYEVVQGALVRYSTNKSGAHPPTAVFIHGILGSRKNLQSFAKTLVEGFPSWQVVLVDLRCHGDSAALPLLGPHTVHSAAADVLRLLRSLQLFPHVLLGHSFGGKVVMSMISQFGGPRLPRPVQAWVLDTLPGEVRAGDADGANQPAHFIRELQAVPLPIPGRNHLVEHLQAAGFAPHLARWMTTNVRPANPADRSSGLAWTFDLQGIDEMYASYEETSLWPLLQAPPQGLSLDFVRAERSSWRWAAGDQQAIHDLGHRVHLLRDAGHWVHTDNPVGLFDIISPSIGTADLHLQRTRR